MKLSELIKNIDKTTKRLLEAKKLNASNMLTYNLLEMPVHTKQNMLFSHLDEEFEPISDEIKNKKYKILEKIEENQILHFVISNTLTEAAALLKGDENWHFLSRVSLSKENINGKPVLQEDEVDTVEEYKGNNIAVNMYLVLVNKGYTLMSSSNHWNGGLGLWRKLGMISKRNGVKINVFDTIKQTFLKDDKDKLVQFTGGTSEYSKLWSIYPDNEKQNIVLVAQKT